MSFGGAAMKASRTRRQSRLSRRLIGRRPKRTATRLEGSERGLEGIAGFITMVVSLSIAFSIAYFLMAQVYRLTAFDPAPLAKQVINSFAGLFLLALVGVLMSRMFRSSAWAQQMNMLAPLLHAMEQ